MFHPTTELPTFEKSDKVVTEPFFLVRGNKQFYEGKARFPAIRQPWGLVMMSVFFVFFAAIFILSLTDLFNLMQLQRFGLPATGVIMSRRTVSSKSTNYYLTYSFNLPSGASQNTFKNEQQVSGATYNSHPEGTKVSLLYWKPNPSLSILADKDSDNGPRLFPILFVGGFFAIFAIAFGMLVRVVLRDRHYAKHGQIILGEVCYCNGEMTGGKNRYFKVSVKYRFQSPSGQVLAKEQSEARSDLRKVRLPKYGTPAAILYLDDKHYVML